MSKKITIVLSTNRSTLRKVYDTMPTENTCSKPAPGRVFYDFCSCESMAVAYKKTLAYIQEMKLDEALWASTTNEAVVMALRTAIARNLVRAKDVKILFFDEQDKCHAVLFEDIANDNSTWRSIEYSNYPDGFLDLWPHAMAELADVKPDEGWEPRPVFNESGDDYLPEVKAVLGENLMFNKV